MKVWILRHGLSTFNLQHRYQGCSDEPELTEAGRMSARITAERLSSAGIGDVISSPLRRAAQTARELLDAWSAKTADLRLHVDERLHGFIDLLAQCGHFQEGIVLWGIAKICFQRQCAACNSVSPSQQCFSQFSIDAVCLRLLQ